MKSGELPLKTQLSRLIKVRNAIRKAPPEKLDMSTWCSDRRLTVEEAQKELNSSCGTTYCIGGFAACLASSAFISRVEDRSLARVGQLWLFGDTGKSVFDESLFFVEDWPARYRERYSALAGRNGMEKRKAIVISFLNYRIYNLKRRIANRS